MPEVSVGLPKRRLVEIILEHVNPPLLRHELHIAPETNIRTRLMSFTKLYLVRLFLRLRGPAGRRILKEFADAYPIHGPPTFFLVHVIGRPSMDFLRAELKKLERLERRGKVFFGEDKAVRAVYVQSRAKPVNEEPLVYEFELAYERRFTYIPVKGPHRGELLVEYSLETALVWLPVEHTRYAVLACSHFQAVVPIRDYCQEKLSFVFINPFLTEEMQRRIAASGLLRTASFRTLVRGADSVADVSSLTLSDQRLTESRLFAQVANDPDRDQTSGFYMNHPDLESAGLGISNRYARIWTPTILDRDALVKLTTGIIRHVEREMARAKQNDLDIYIQTYANLKARVGRRLLTGELRTAFECLVVAAWKAKRVKGRKRWDMAESLPLLLRHADALQLRFKFVMDCPYCGSGVLAYCPDCWWPQTPVLAEPTTKGPRAIRRNCRPNCPGNGTSGTELVCYCDERVEILDPYQHLFAYPSPQLEDAIARFSKDAELAMNSFFVIADGILRLLREEKEPDLHPLRLHDLRSWSKIPGIGRPLTSRELSIHGRRALLGRLGRTREKCFRRGEGLPPKRETCEACMAEEPTKIQFADGQLCLGRLFGIPIGQTFDGIHHGYEKADIVYQDRRGQSPAEETIAIHLKSRSRVGGSGTVGRGNHSIKGLYAQLVFLAYQVHSGDVKADVIGVSIPNLMSDEVKDSMRHLCGRLGVKLLFIEEEEWIAIARAAYERMPGPNEKAPAEKGRMKGRKARAAEAKLPAVH